MDNIDSIFNRKHNNDSILFYIFRLEKGEKKMRLIEENTKVKKIMRKSFNENFGFHKKIGREPVPKSEEIKVNYIRKRGGYWIADIKVIRNYCYNVPIKIIERMLEKEKRYEEGKDI